MSENKIIKTKTNRKRPKINNNTSKANKHIIILEFDWKGVHGV